MLTEWTLGKHQATKPADTAGHQRVPGDICNFEIPKTFLSKEEMFLHIQACAAYYYPKSKECGATEESIT